MWVPSLAREDPACCLAWPKRKRKEPAFSFIFLLFYFQGFYVQKLQPSHLLPHSLFFPMAFSGSLKFAPTSLATLWLDAFCMLLLEIFSCPDVDVRKNPDSEAWVICLEEANLGGSLSESRGCFLKFTPEETGSVRSSFLRRTGLSRVALTQLETFLHTIRVVS